MAMLGEPGHFERHGKVFTYQLAPSGNMQVTITDGSEPNQLTFWLTSQEVIELYSELDWCPDCGELLSVGGHGPGTCYDPDDPGGIED